jgi:hypothetical protein
MSTVFQDEPAVPVSAEMEIEANIERIRCFHRDGEGYASTSQLIMFGLALCRPELLEEARYPNKDIKAAWARLNDSQREAVIRWWQD